ncbi:MAG: sorbosone dehydrogenase family protein [Roseiarcus sp.]|uniref:PQQ-dependent sugar dehydrogenase n=1 Tax=Roseiarcus sp. TaxID=1969460 RepID=UPI003C645830
MRLGFIVLLGLVGAGTAFADETVRTGAAAFGDWRTDAPGVRRLITPADLPAPFATPSARNMSPQAARTEADIPKAPPGFAVDLFATGLSTPRVIRVAPNGDIFVAETGAGRVLVFRPGESQAGPAQGKIFAGGLQQPYGIAFYPSGQEPRFVYVATPDSVVRFPYRSGETKTSGPPETIASLPGGGSHWTRDLAFSPDDKTLFVSVGSSSNVAEGARIPDEAEIAGPPLGASFGDEQRRADVLAFDPEGRNERVYATGIRNCSGLAIQPGTGALWCAVNERDGLGDDLPPDYATRVVQGAFYGWPWYYLGDHHDPRHQGERADLANRITTPDVLIQAHSAPLGIAFYTADQFPSEYRGDAFLTLHGSWNRSKRTGYKVVRLLMKDGKPTGAYEDFLVGFFSNDASVWGRPVGVAVARDGSLLVGEDDSGSIWRVKYRGK